MERKDEVKILKERIRNYQLVVQQLGDHMKTIDVLLHHVDADIRSFRAEPTHTEYFEAAMTILEDAKAIARSYR